jgi:hypothetical protein
VLQRSTGERGDLAGLLADLDLAQDQATQPAIAVAEAIPATTAPAHNPTTTATE